jgi:hypothetical protein
MNGARHATSRWLSNPPFGAGHLYSESRAFRGMPFSIGDDESAAAKTTPGELLAAAYSAFMATGLRARVMSTAFVLSAAAAPGSVVARAA